MIVSRLAPAVSTISMISPWHHSVVTSLMRTQRVLRPQSRLLSAQLILLRASTFADGATASSRSQNTWSAADAAAFWSIFSLLPGTESCDRRGGFCFLLATFCLLVGGDGPAFAKKIGNFRFAQARLP